MATMNPVLDALDRAPPVGDDIDPEEIAEVLALSQGGGEVVPQEQIERTIADMRRLAG